MELLHNQCAVLPEYSGWPDDA